jgi:hypothetical protein
MAGYSQSELTTIFSASGIDSAFAQRRLADIIFKTCEKDLLNTTGQAAEQLPQHNYNTRAYLANMARPLIEFASGIYGLGMTAAQITAAAQIAGPSGEYDYLPLSPTFATAAPQIVQAIYACMELGSESIDQGTFVASNLWTPVNGFSVGAAGITYAHNAGPNTVTQTAANRAAVATMVANAWYVLDFEITTAVATIANLTSYQLGLGVCSVATNIAPITAAGFGKAEKKSLIFYSSAGAAAGDFVFTAVSGAAAGNVVTNLSLKQILNTAYSTNPLSNFTPAQALLYGSSGSNYVKKYIAGVVTSTLQKMAQGEYSVYGTLNKVADVPVDPFGPVYGT